MDLNALRAAVKPLSDFGSDELTFDVEGVSVTIRPLLPDEDVAVQQYAAAVLVQTQEDEGLGEDDPLTRAAAMQYMDKFRTEAISYALVQVGDADFRDIQYIDTGEATGDGTPIRITRQKALRQIISESWSRGMITIAFAKYGDLVTKIAEKADKVAKESVADLTAEIERLGKRMANLKQEREQRAKGDPSLTMKQIRTLVDAGDAMEREIDQTIEGVRADRDAVANIQAAEAAADAMRAQGAFDPAPETPPGGGWDDPEVEEPLPEEPTPAAPAPRASVIPAAAPPPSPKVSAPDGFISSFADPEEDPNAALAESERIALAAMQARRSSRANLGDPLSQAEQIGMATGQDGKPIPMFTLPSTDVDLGGGSQPAATRPAETISARGKKKPPTAPEGSDPDPRTGTLNPNFNPPRK